MLVLTRRAGEAIMLGDEIEVSVLSILGDTKVRLGVQAPESLRVTRKDYVGDADSPTSEDPGSEPLD